MIKEKFKKNYKMIIGIVIGMTLSLTGVYAAACISAGDVAFGSKTGLNSTNVQDALDELNNKANQCTTQASPSSDVLCKRATSLHSVKCEGDNMKNCAAASSDNQNGTPHYNAGDTLTYGQISQSGLNTGDAFDCDVNGDGTYDPENERFYYVSDYYDTNSNSFNNDYATLVYYTDTVNGAPSLSTKYKWNQEFTEGHSQNNMEKGPSDALLGLPTTTQWSNTSLYKTNRKIQDSGKNDTFIESFNYEGYAARLLTYFEISNGCINIPAGSIDDGMYRAFENCSFLEENVGYENSYFDGGYWLETIDYMYSRPLLVGNRYKLLSSNGGNSFYVRPVIDVKKTRIEY